MASLYTVLSTLQQQVSNATEWLVSVAADTYGTSLNVMVGIGWPSQKTLQNNVRGGASPSVVVSIYDRGLATDTTRWLPYQTGLTPVEPTITATPSATVIPAKGHITVAIGGSVTAGDAIGLVIAPVSGGGGAQVAIGSHTDTPTTMTTQLASLINADPVLSILVDATASGTTLTLTSLTTAQLLLAANVGNGGTRTREIGRRQRNIQIAIWTRTEDDRNTVGDVVEGLIAGMEADFGLTFPDGTMGRVIFHGDHQLEEAVLADTYRRDFLVSVEYGITATDALYDILAPVTQYIIT